MPDKDTQVALDHESTAMSVTMEARRIKEDFMARFDIDMANHTKWVATKVAELKMQLLIWHTEANAQLAINSVDLSVRQLSGPLDLQDRREKLEKYIAEAREMEKKKEQLMAEYHEKATQEMEDAYAKFEKTWRDAAEVMREAVARLEMIVVEKTAEIERLEALIEAAAQAEGAEQH